MFITYSTRLALVAGLAATFTATAPAHAQFNFGGSSSYGVGARPSDVALADFNGDTHTDMAVTVDNPDRVEILFGTGDGTFVPGGSAFLPNSSSPGDLVAGDFDGDQDIDLAVALQDFAQVLIVNNLGNGTFVAGSGFSVGFDARGLDVGDMDLDNDLDLVVANRDSNTGTVLTNNGSGSFTSTTLPAGLEPRGAAFGDFNGDNLLDVAITNHDSSSISLYLNNGSGGFNGAGSLFTASVRPEGIVSRDLDGNGLDDLAVATNGNTNQQNFVTVYMAIGGGTFSAQANYPTGGQDTSHIVAADFNCDNLIDVATSNADSNNVSVLANVGGGIFGAPTIVAAGIEPENLAAADLDHDNVADLATANKQSNNVTVNINETCDQGGLAIQFNGVCPGAMTLSISGGTPGGTVAVLGAATGGSTTIPNGFPCAGTVLDLGARLTLISTTSLDGTGSGSVAGNVPAVACGLIQVQALDVATCATSNVTSP